MFVKTPSESNLCFSRVCDMSKKLKIKQQQSYLDTFRDTMTKKMCQLSGLSNNLANHAERPGTQVIHTLPNS